MSRSFCDSFLSKEVYFRNGWEGEKQGGKWVTSRTSFGIVYANNNFHIQGDCMVYCTEDAHLQLYFLPNFEAHSVFKLPAARLGSDIL